MPYELFQLKHINSERMAAGIRKWEKGMFLPPEWVADADPWVISECHGGLRGRNPQGEETEKREDRSQDVIAEPRETNS